MASNWSSVFSRILFVVCFLTAALAVWGRVLNAFGFTLVRAQFSPSRLLEVSGGGGPFLVALTLGAIKATQTEGRGTGSASGASPRGAPRSGRGCSGTLAF